MRNRGQETSYSGRKNTMEEFRITVDLGDRMDAITSDGVCAEVVIERGGSRDPDVEFLRGLQPAPTTAGSTSTSLTRPTASSASPLSPSATSRRASRS